MTNAPPLPHLPSQMPHSGLPRAPALGHSVPMNPGPPPRPERVADPLQHTLERVGDQRPAQLIATTNPGLETLVLDELRERWVGAGYAAADIERLDSGLGGRVHITVPESLRALLPVACQLRSIHHLLRPITQFRLPYPPDLASVTEPFATLDLPELDPPVPFRVTGDRTGTHPFTSMDMARAAGAVIVERFQAPVNLEHWTVDVQIHVVERTALVGMRVTPEPLSHRHAMPYRQRVALKPNIAYAALRLAGVDATTRAIADPFCGSGTILLEAGSMAPAAQLDGGDHHPPAAEGAWSNLEANGLGARSTVRIAPAEDLSDWIPANQLDAIVTNPPYGYRLGKGIHFEGFYARFFEAAQRVLRPGARLVMLTYRHQAALRAMRRIGGWRSLGQRVVSISGVYPRLVVLEKRRSRPAESAHPIDSHE